VSPEADEVVVPVTAERSRALRRKLLRPTEAIEDVAAREVRGTHYAGIERGGELVAVGWTRAEGGPGLWRVGAMATMPEHRGEGLAAAVLAALTEHARDHGASGVWCNARLHAIGFYERQGWEVESEEVFEVPGAGPHRRMGRALEG
jgi:GNAT superfamily N-acetyltransferase